jgi:MFS family permease
MQKAETPPEAAEPRPLSRQPNFLKLWSGQSISTLGSEITDLALPLVAIYTLHAGAAAIGLVNTARWLPFLLISLWVGAWTDRHKRRKLLIRVDLGRAVVMGSIVVMGLTHVLSVPLLVLAVFIFGVLTVLFDVSYYSYVPAIVPPSDLLPANARLQASASVAQVGGPGLGGLLVQLVGAPLTLLADAISFLVSAASLTWIRAREPEPEPPVRGENIVRQIRAGIAVVLHDRLLRALVGTSAIYNAFSQWIVTLFALFAVRDLGMTAGMIGLVVSVAAVGALAGSLVTSFAIKRMGVGSAMIWSVAVECASLFALPFAPAGDRTVSFLILAGAFGVNGIGVALSSVVAISIRQTVTPRDMLGRMNATYRFVSYGVIALGALGGGLAGQVWGPRTGMLIGCVGLLGTIAWVALGPLPRLKELPTAPPTPAETAETAVSEQDEAESVSSTLTT